MSLINLARFLAIGVVSLALVAVSSASRATDFYAGKTLNIVVGFPPGGGVDGTARLLERHYAKYIPGNPKVVIRNMPGAAGNVAANYLYNKADADGTTIGYPGRGWALAKLFGEPGIQFEALEFTYLGSPGVDNGILWLRSKLGITNIEQLKKADKELHLASFSASGHQSIVPAILARNGWKLKAMSGYQGTSATILAIERGEVDGIILSYGSVKSSRRDMIDSKTILPLFQTHKIEKDIPYLFDHVPEKDKPVLNLVLAGQTLGLPLVGPPKMPADRTEILRKAFLAVSKDPDYIKDAEKIGVDVDRPYGGEELKKLTAESLKVSESTIKQYQSFAPPQQQGK